MRSDAFLWYSVPTWQKYGLAVPNFSNDSKSQNDTIRYLVEVIGRNLQAIMFHTDARLRKPPSVNTLARIHKLCVRARSIMASRAIAPGTFNLESAHAIPAAEEFKVYPCPYFDVSNQWLKQYCGLTLLALTEAIQHSENAQPIEISTGFAGLLGQYIQRVYRLLATELLNVPIEEASKPDFTLTDAQIASYNPFAFFTSTEMIDTVPDLEEWPTEDDLKELTDGIPISRLPALGRYPSGVGNNTSGGVTTPASASFAKPPGV
jgi:hypothetical protein